MTFHDHFSSLAQDYSRFRPHYPKALFRYLSAQSPGKALAWDCATGSGQAALGLADFFDRVIATDASAAQLAHAETHPKVDYRLASAEASGLAESSVDLVTVAQAFHWFDREKFFAELNRVLQSDGRFAAWTYHLLRCSPKIDALIEIFYGETLGSFWTPERRLVENKYQSISFPFPEIPTPSFQMEASWSLAELLGYLGTWSALKKYREALGQDPLPALSDRLFALWGKAQKKKEVHWPISLRLFKKD